MKNWMKVTLITVAIVIALVGVSIGIVAIDEANAVNTENTARNAYTVMTVVMPH